jgi:hypothetical protein
MTDYEKFLDAKAQIGSMDGFAATSAHGFLFDFQAALVEWITRKGRGAIFADCGLGKTPMQLAWADNVVRHTNGRVLILTPLAVSAQTVEEGAKFGIEVRKSIDGTRHAGITVTNYERLHHFNPADYVGVICDESSAIKSFDGARRQAVTAFMKKMQYRLLCTATAAPNDYIELGTTSEALGCLGYMDMLNRFFKNDLNNSATGRQYGGAAKWRFKGHAEQHFWRWVCSWARAIRRPSDLGFSDMRFVLPPLIEQEHVVDARNTREGMLFDLPAHGLWEEREEARRTLAERCERAASLVNNTGEPAVVWCHLNDEGKQLRQLIPDAVEISGANSDDEKEDAFLRFARGQIRVLITKPKIGAWGLNWQHCAHMTFFPSHSFEAYYQAVRRSLRFGQNRPVTVDIVTTAGGQGIKQNLQRKSQAADQMFSSLVQHMNHEMALERQSTFSESTQIPSWLLPNR